ncbi:hypothetical protein ES703_80052 [subsurface metagenome]
MRIYHGDVDIVKLGIKRVLRLKETSLQETFKYNIKSLKLN